MRILKTVGLLNLLDTNSYLPSPNAISLSVGVELENDRILGVLDELQRGKRILHFRGTIGGYCLWPYTSVDLDRAREDASRAIGPITNIVPFIKRFLQTGSLLARRHYIDTGNLRHFAIHYGICRRFRSILNSDVSSADGLVLIPLSETPETTRRRSNSLNQNACGSS